MPLFHADLLFLNHEGGLPRLTAGEGEVERGIQSRCLAGLEDERQSVKEKLNAIRPQAVADVLNLFVRKPFGDVILGVGIVGDVNRLLLLLKRPNNFLDVSLSISEKWTNDIL